MVSDIGIPSDAEMRRFVLAVQSKVADVSLAYERKGKKLMRLATPAVKAAVSDVATLQKRWQRGEFVHTRREEESLKVVSKWLVEAWHRLHGTEIPGVTWIRDEQ